MTKTSRAGGEEQRPPALDEALNAARVILFRQTPDLAYVWLTRPFLGPADTGLTSAGLTDADLLPEPALDQVLREKRAALETGEPRSWLLDLSEDGRFRIMRMRVAPTRDETGAIDGLTGGAIDITTEVAAEHDVRASERMLRYVLDNLFAFVGVLDLDGRMIEANRAPLEAAGLRRSQVIGQPFWDCAWWDGLEAVQARLKETVKRVRDGATLRFDTTMKLSGGHTITLDFQLAPLRDNSGEIIRLVASGTDITWRKNAERDLQTALVRTELALEAGHTGVWEWDIAGDELVWDLRMRNLFGVEADTPLSTSTLEGLIHREDVLAAREARAAATDPAGGGEYDVEFRLAAKEPQAPERWIAMRGRSIFEDGRAMRMIGIARDVTERRQREAHVHMLMREIAHRSKNLLAVIQAMARQTATAGGTAKEFETRFAARLEALAGSQDLLVMQDWHGASIRDLARSQLIHYSDLIGDRILVEGPDLLLKPEAAQNIGLALHELSTNAAKYGALSNKSGRVRLDWALDERDGDPILRMVWEETGGPKVTPPAREGFGHKVLKRIAAHALEGRVTLDFAEGGLVWRMEIPTSYIVQPRKPEEDRPDPTGPGKLSALGAGPLNGRV